MRTFGKALREINQRVIYNSQSCIYDFCLKSNGHDSYIIGYKQFNYYIIEF